MRKTGKRIASVIGKSKVISQIVRQRKTDREKLTVFCTHPDNARVNVDNSETGSSYSHIFQFIPQRLRSRVESVRVHSQNARVLVHLYVHRCAASSIVFIIVVRRSGAGGAAAVLVCW